MRRLVLDTETTGLEVSQGHRVIEIAAVELVDRRPTGRHFHRYLNPEREIDPGAVQVHGLTADFLADKPRFADVVEELLSFLDGGEVLIHNAAFDVGFLDAELAALGRPGLGSLCQVTDTLALARSLHPGKRNSLDALCERYQVDHSRRTLHGALLDAQLLADIWLAMTRGQDALDIAPVVAAKASSGGAAPKRPAALRVIAPSPEEAEAHAALCERIDKDSGGRCLWKAAGAGSPP